MTTPKLKLSISTAVITLVITAIALTLTTYAAISTSQNVPATGTVSVSADLSVYSNSLCTTPLSFIDWGNLTVGGTTNQTIYIKNTGSGLSLALSMSTSDWTPADSNGPITLTWNKENTRLQPGQSVAATLTLTVSQSIVDVTGFNVQISITGTN